MNVKSGIIKQYLFAGLVLGLCALAAAVYERGYLPLGRADEFRSRLMPRFYEMVGLIHGTARQYHQGASRRVRSGAPGNGGFDEMRRELFKELDRRHGELHKRDTVLITDEPAGEEGIPESVPRRNTREDRYTIAKEERPSIPDLQRKTTESPRAIETREPAPVRRKPHEKKKPRTLSARELVPPVSLVKKKASRDASRPSVAEKRAPAVERPRERRMPPDLYGPFAHGSRSERSIALSFDSGETGGDLSRCHALIERLIAARTPTTFFLTGRFVESHPEIARKLSRVSFFELGNHSYSHPDLTALPTQRVLEELRRTQEALRRVTGRQASLFRAPYGKLNNKVIETAAELGLRAVQWDVSAEDYRKGADGSSVARTVLGAATNGSVVVMHMSGRSGAGGDAIDAILEGLRKRGLRPATVSALMNDSAQPRKEQARNIDARRGTAN